MRATAAILRCSINKRKKTLKPFMAHISSKGTHSRYLEQRTQCISSFFFFFFFIFSASRLGKLTLFSYHKPLETLHFENVFLNTQAKKEISQLLSFKGRRKAVASPVCTP